MTKIKEKIANNKSENKRQKQRNSSETKLKTKRTIQLYKLTKITKFNKKSQSNNSHKITKKRDWKRAMGLIHNNKMMSSWTWIQMKNSSIKQRPT